MVYLVPGYVSTIYNGLLLCYVVCTWVQWVVIMLWCMYPGPRYNGLILFNAVCTWVQWVVISRRFNGITNFDQFSAFLIFLRSSHRWDSCMLKWTRFEQAFQHWDTASSDTIKARDISRWFNVKHNGFFSCIPSPSDWNLTGQGRSSLLRVSPPNIQYTPLSVTSLPPNFNILRDVSIFWQMI